METVNGITNRKLNSEFDSAIVYVPRSERNWKIISLLGQVEIILSSPKSSKWIKIEEKNVNDEINKTWFIR